MTRLVMIAACLSLFAAESNAQTPANIVRFRNPGTSELNVHLRVGPIGVPADSRGSANVTVRPGPPHEENVGNDGDIWFAYGNQVLGSQINVPLCRATGGTTVFLDRTQSCFVNN